jgi:hypothetical protein
MQMKLWGQGIVIGAPALSTSTVDAKPEDPARSREALPDTVIPRPGI